MTRNQIIEKLFTGKNFTDCINKMEPEHLREDLKMEVMVIVCEWPDDKVIKMHTDKVLEFCVVRVILNQIKSKSSPFAKKYRRPMVEMTRDIPDVADEQTEEAHEFQQAVIDSVDDLYWYNKEMLQLYIKHGNYRAVHKETGIPFTSCYDTIKKTMKQLKDKARKEKIDYIINNPIK